MLTVPLKHAHAIVLDAECAITAPASATGNGLVLHAKLKRAPMNVATMVFAIKVNASATLDTRMPTAVCSIAPKIVTATEVASITRVVFANPVMRALVVKLSNVL